MEQPLRSTVVKRAVERDTLEKERLTKCDASFTIRPVLEAKAGVVCLAAATALAMLRLVPCDYSTLSTLRNREIETETLIFAPISLSYIEID